MSNEETQRLAAALEQLEIEQRRREDGKIAAGEAIRLPLHCVLNAGDDYNKLIEKAKADQIAALRANGEMREIVFEDPTVVVTGVPRGDNFGKWKEEVLVAQYPDRYAVADRPTATAPAKSTPVDPTVLEWKPFHLTVTPPSERDTGMIIEAKYAIAGGELRLSFQGRVYAEQIGPNDDALVAARKLLRSKYGQHGEFFGRINYPRSSIH